MRQTTKTTISSVFGRLHPQQGCRFAASEEGIVGLMHHRNFLRKQFGLFGNHRHANALERIAQFTVVVSRSACDDVLFVSACGFWLQECYAIRLPPTVVDRTCRYGFQLACVCNCPSSRFSTCRTRCYIFVLMACVHRYVVSSSGNQLRLRFSFMGAAAPMKRGSTVLLQGRASSAREACALTCGLHLLCRYQPLAQSESVSVANCLDGHRNYLT